MVLYVTTHIFVVFSIFFDFLSEWIFKLFQVFLSVMNFLVFFLFFFQIVFLSQCFIVVKRILSTLPNFQPVLQKKFFLEECNCEIMSPPITVKAIPLWLNQFTFTHQQTFLCTTLQANNMTMSAFNKRWKWRKVIFCGGFIFLFCIILATLLLEKMSIQTVPALEHLLKNC